MSVIALTTCEPCSERHKQTKAIKWCSDCEESLCKECTECHLSMKATKYHHVVDLKVAHSFPSASDWKYKSCQIHDCHHFEYFCVEHQMMCCRECMTSDLHRTCRKILTINAASKHVKTSKQFKEVEDELEHILETLTNVLSDRRANLAEINSHELVKDSIARYKAKIVQHLNVLEGRLLDDLDRIQKDVVDKLNNEMEQVATEREIVQVYKNQITFIKQHGSDRHTFLFAHKLRIALHDLKDQLVSKIARMRSKAVQHTISENILDSLSLGSVFVQEIPCTEKFKLHIDDYKLYQSFKLCQKIDMTSIDKKAFITGMAIADDKLFLCNCDWNHNIPKVLVCNKNGEFLAEIEVKGAPWDITVLPGENKAVVVLPDTNSIQFIDIKTLTSGIDVKMAGSDEKRGISASNDRIFVGGMDRYIYVLDFKGTLLSTILVNGEKCCYLLTTSKGDLVYSDFASIHRIKVDGSEVYTFKSPDLKNPKKITTDELGNLYIVGKDSHSIHRLTPDGALLDVILHEDVNIHHPRAVFFDKETSKLFISNHSGKELLIFNCS